MDLYTFTTLREACKRSGGLDVPTDDPDQFYRVAFADAVKMRSGQFFGQITNERDWEKAHRPYYNVWPSIVPMLTRLNLDLDSALIRLPLPALCVRLPKEKNPLHFPWKGKQVQIRCMLMGEINEGRGISILIDVGEVMGGGDLGVPIYTYRNFRREGGLTVEGALRELGRNGLSDLGVQIPEDLITDCVRLCCTLCLLENDPEIISPDVLREGSNLHQRRRDHARWLWQRQTPRVGDVRTITNYVSSGRFLPTNSTEASLLPGKMAVTLANRLSISSQRDKTG